MSLLKLLMKHIIVGIIASCSLFILGYTVAHTPISQFQGAFKSARISALSELDAIEQQQLKPLKIGLTETHNNVLDRSLKLVNRLGNQEDCLRSGRREAYIHEQLKNKLKKEGSLLPIAAILLCKTMPLEDLTPTSQRDSLHPDEKSLTALDQIGYPLQDEAMGKVELVHFIMLYKELVPSMFCGVESVIRAILENSNSEVMSSGNHSTVKQEARVISRNVTIIVWLSSMELLLDEPIRHVVQRLREVLQQRRHPNESVRLRLQFKKLSFWKTVSGTPLQRFYACMVGQKASLGIYARQNLANALRLAILSKYRGIYLDADMIALRDPTSLKDGVGAQSFALVNNAMMKLTKGNQSRVFLHELMTEFVRDYNGNRWGHQGPNLITRVVNGCSCSSDSISEAGKHQNNPIEETKVSCFDRFTSSSSPALYNVTIWPIKTVHPIPHQKVFLLNRSVDEVQSEFRNDFLNSTKTRSVLLHLWHTNLAPYEEAWCKSGIIQYAKSFVGQLRKQRCKIVFRTMIRERDCRF